jgi:hypothetical protein
MKKEKKKKEIRLGKSQRVKLLDARIVSNGIVNYDTFKEYLLDKDYLIGNYVKRTFERDIEFLREKLRNKYPELHEENNGKLLLFNKDDDNYYYLTINLNGMGICAFSEITEDDFDDFIKILRYNPDFFKSESKLIYRKIEATILENHEYDQSKIAWNPRTLLEIGLKEGQQNFSKMLDCILELKPVKVKHYKMADGKVNDRQFLPLLLKELNSGWNIGWYLLVTHFKEGDKEINVDLKSLSLYSLDTLSEITPINQKIKINIPENFDPNDYFKNAIVGLTRQNRNNPEYAPEKVILKVLPKQDWVYIYLEKYHLHHSQVINYKKNTVELFVELDKDLEIFLKKYCDVFVVEEPISLRNKLKETFNNVLANYNN